MRYDLHIHSKYSWLDGAMNPRQIIKSSVKKGLDGIAVTDHNTIKGGVITKKMAGKEIDVIVGSEIMTDRGEVIGLFLESEVAPGSFCDVISSIRSQGGLTMIPHPFDSGRGALMPTKDDIKMIDCVEGFNSRCVFSKFNVHALEFAHNFGIPVVAGSDAHFEMEVGNAWTSFEGGARDSIKRGALSIHGYRSTPMVHIMTKILKLKRSILFDSKEF